MNSMTTAVVSCLSLVSPPWKHHDCIRLLAYLCALTLSPSMSIECPDLVEQEGLAFRSRITPRCDTLRKIGFCTLFQIYSHSSLHPFHTVLPAHYQHFAGMSSRLPSIDPVKLVVRKQLCNTYKQINIDDHREHSQMPWKTCEIMDSHKNVQKRLHLS